MRNTPSLRAILEVMLEDPEIPRYGYELVKLTGYGSGTVNVLLDKLEGEGFVSRSWEDSDPGAVHRPLRRYSQLTEKGVAFAREKLGEWERKRPRAL
jgi:DNA-binding PadR family transcriptional regulator